MAQVERQQTVLNILQNLHDLGGLKKLFWEELNYERENKPLSTRGWPDSARKALVDDPILFASGKPQTLKDILKGQYECYTGTADLYVYFFERSLQLLRTGGVLSFITSNKYFRAGYGERLRTYLAYSTRPQVVLDFGDAPVFTSIAYPAILVTQKTQHLEKGQLPLSRGPTGVLHPSNLPPEEWQARVLTWKPVRRSISSPSYSTCRPIPYPNVISSPMDGGSKALSNCASSNVCARLEPL